HLSLFQGLSLRIECLAELHDVHALLTQRGAYRRTGVRLACWDLQLDITGYLLRHGRYSCGYKRSPSGKLPLVRRLRATLLGAYAPTFQRGRNDPALQLTLLDLREVQFHGRPAPQDLHRHLPPV